MGPEFHLDGVRMHVVSTADGGEVSRATLFHFVQDGTLVSARYAGGTVLLGHLVGVLSADTLCFRYAQVDRSGRVDGGYSTCELGRTADGRLRLIEHFRWESREGSGTNVFEELEGQAEA